VEEIGLYVREGKKSRIKTREETRRESKKLGEKVKEGNARSLFQEKETAC